MWLVLPPLAPFWGLDGNCSVEERKLPRLSCVLYGWLEAFSTQNAWHSGNSYGPRASWQEEAIN